MLKVAFDAVPLLGAKTGVGHFTERLVKSLAKVGHGQVELTGFYFNFLNRKKIAGLPQAPNISYRHSLLMPGKLQNLCRRLGFQLPLELFTKTKAEIGLFTNFVPLPMLSGQSVMVVHDLAFHDCPQFVSGANARFLRRFVPKTISRAGMVVAVSDFTKSRLIDIYNVPAEKIYVMPNPPREKSAPDFSILKKHGLAENFILFVGTLEPRKNLVGLLNAYAKLPSDLREKYPLVLAGGSGWHDDEIKSRLEQVQAEGYEIIQTGYVSEAEKSALYAKCALVVQPAHYEGFGMPLLEAFAYGKPVVCSDIAVFREVAGDAAIFFDQNDPNDMAKTLAGLLTDKSKLKDLASKGQKRLAAFPDWEQIAKAFLDRLRLLSR